MIDATNGYVDVMRPPRIQVAEHLHYVAGIPCQENTSFHIWSSIFLHSFAAHFDRRGLQCSLSDSPNLGREPEICQILIKD